MNRRDFLKSLLGAAAVAALPQSVLAAAEEAAAPLADACESWTPSDYFFSVWVKRETSATYVDQEGIIRFHPRGRWERIGMRLSKEVGDALSGNTIHSVAGAGVLQSVLKTIGEKQAEMYGAQLEQNPHAPQFSCCEYGDGPPMIEGKRTNLVLYSDSAIKGELK